MTHHGLPPLRDVISQHGLSTRKELGQNFLLDLNVTDKITRLAGDIQGHDVLEIGPGPGGLTRSLLAAGARRVVAVEKDDRCIAALEQVAKFYPNRLSIQNTDAMTFDAAAHLHAPIRVVANLPYNIGTELLVRWLSPAHWPPFWNSLTLMFQKEVAERIIAPAGSKKYGRLSVLAQWRSEAHIVMTLPPTAFIPPPKVHSAVVHLKRLEAPRYPADFVLLQKIVKTAFGQRRKMLRSSLKSLSGHIETHLEAVSIAPTSRAEELTIKQFCALACQLERA